jgi:hypothetical protein
MKNLKSLLMASFLTVGIFSTTLIVSCNQDKCKDVVCNNGGTCNETDGSCNCAVGYEGENCETLSRAKFLVGGVSNSIWTTALGQDNCAAGITYNQTFTPGALSTQIIVTTALGYNGMTATLNISGNTFTQVGTATSGAVTLSNYVGTIDTTWNPDRISFSYTAADGVNTLNCTGNASKN